MRETTTFRRGRLIFITLSLCFCPRSLPNSLGLLTPAREAGKKASVNWKEYISPFIVSPIKENDFNDVWVNEGKEKTLEQINPKKCTAISIRELITKQINIPKKFTSLIHGGKVAILYGEPGHGKTVTAMEMGIAISLGEDFLNFKTYNKAKVLYIDGEMTEHELKERLLSISERYPDLVCEDNDFKLITNASFQRDFGEDLDLFNPQHRKILEEHVVKADVIILDNYEVLTAPQEGETYKSDKKEWANLKKWLNLHRETGDSFILLMHGNKQGNLAGVSQISAKVDLKMKLERVPEDKIIQESFVHFTLTIEKARYLSFKDSKKREAYLIQEEQTNHGWRVV